MSFIKLFEEFVQKKETDNKSKLSLFLEDDEDDQEEDEEEDNADDDGGVSIFVFPPSTGVLEVCGSCGNGVQCGGWGKVLRNRI